MSEYQQYLEFAKSVAYEAGEIMRKYFLNNDVEWKSDKTPLTIADTTINRMVIERINSEFPGHSIVGEEESAKTDSNLVWVCDPVDGALPYSHGLPISSFSLALCDDGEPVVGVVYDPFMDRLFWAEKGGVAYCNGDELHVNAQGFTNSLVSVDGFPSSKPVIDASHEVRTVLTDRGAKIISLWSAVLPAALVAQGQLTAGILNLNQPQDGAAIKVIVEAAGGKVTDLFGNEQRYDRLTKGFIASNGIVHDEIVGIIRQVAEVTE